jgi:MFS family permease
MSESARRSLHPVLWTLLIVPFGAVGGFAGVALVFLANKHGLSVEEGATLIAAGMLPHTWKFFWAPVADTTLSRKRWYLLASAVCIAGIVAMSAIPLGPKTLHLLQGVIFVTNLATTFLGMAVEGLMAHLTAPEQRGRVGGWFQAGNLGGSGIGGGAGLWMLNHVSQPWMAGAALGAVFAGCAAPLLLLPDVQREARGEPLLDVVKDVGRDLFCVLRSRSGLLCALLCFLPIGTGAASGVLAQADVAAHWGAAETEVGLVNGVFSGIVMALGCLGGGQLCARWNSRLVYAGVGLLMAMTTGAMAAAPATPAVFVGFGLAYAFVVGLAYAAFTGFVLEAIGAGAAATKYNIFASLSNMPITYMGLLLAWSVKGYGADGMLALESAAGIAGIAVLAVAAKLLHERREAGPAVVAA